MNSILIDLYFCLGFLFLLFNLIRLFTRKKKQSMENYEKCKAIASEVIPGQNIPTHQQQLDSFKTHTSELTRFKKIKSNLNLLWMIAGIIFASGLRGWFAMDFITTFGMGFLALLLKRKDKAHEIFIAITLFDIVFLSIIIYKYFSNYPFYGNR